VWLTASNTYGRTASKSQWAPRGSRDSPYERRRRRNKDRSHKSRTSEAASDVFAGIKAAEKKNVVRPTPAARRPPRMRISIIAAQIARNCFRR